MRYSDAKHLHKGDEIILKNTNEIVEIIEVEIYEKDIFVNATTMDGYSRIHHTEFK